MKELIRFRQFLAEGQINESVSPAALAKVYADEIENVKQNEQEDEIPAYEKGIEMLKQGVLPEKVNDEVGNMLVQITGEYGDPTVFMDLARKMDAQGQLNENLAGLKAGRFDDSRYETLYVFSPSKIEDITYGEEELDSVDLPSGKYHAILWHNSDLEVYTANSEEELVKELEEDFFDEGAFGDFEGLKAAANDSEPDGDSNHGIALFANGQLVAGPQDGVEVYK